MALSLVIEAGAFGAEHDRVTPLRQDQPLNETYPPQEAIPSVWS
jgi:hypothetical protein